MNRRFTTLSILGLLLASALLLNGCGGVSESSVAGVYEIDKAAIKAAAEAEMKKEQDPNDPMAGFGASMMMGMIDSMNMTMTLNADKTATMVVSAMGQSDTATGTWSLSGSEITVTVASPGDTAEPVTGTVDGDTITLTPPSEEDMPFDLVFKKK